MNLQNIKLELPSGWEEASRMGSEKQIVIRVYHVSPTSKVDSKDLQDHPLPSDNPNVSITRIAPTVPSTSQTLEGFYTGMSAMIASGLMPSDYTQAKLDELWKGMTATPHAERPGDADLANDIDIIQCPDEETAWQTLKNKAMMPTQGFDVPIPGGISAPGMPQNMTMNEYLQSDILKGIVPKEQFDKLQTMLKEVKNKIPQVKQDYEKAGIKYREGTFLGCKSVYYEAPNPTPPPKAKMPPGSRKSSGGGGSRGDIGMDPLPKFDKPYSPTNTYYLGIVYKNFVINGSLLTTISYLPTGNTPCYSLTQTKKVTKTSRIGDATFTDITIVPLVSDYAQEGYVYREQVEEIYKNIFSKLNTD